MATDRKEAQLSQYRLDGEPVPDDVKAILAHHDEFSERSNGIELNWKKGWAPWLDTSYLSASERKNPDIMANVKAIKEVCELIAFIAAEEDGNYYGYWRGPKKRPIAKSPLVRLDNEGQFELLAGTTFAEAILVGQTYDEEQFTELRGWMRSIGIKIDWKSADGATYPTEKDQPGEMHKKLYDQYLGKKSSQGPSSKSQPSRGTQTATELHTLLGRHIDDVSKDPFVLSLGTGKRKRSEDNEYLKFISAGIEIGAEERFVSKITLFAEGYQDYKKYKGPLPEGLDFSNSRTTVNKKLGKPSASGDSRVLVIKFPAWDRYDREFYSLFTRYPDEEDSIWAVSLQKPVAVAQEPDQESEPPKSKGKTGKKGK